MIRQTNDDGDSFDFQPLTAETRDDLAGMFAALLVVAGIMAIVAWIVVGFVTGG